MATNLREAIVEEIELFKESRDKMYETSDMSNNVATTHYCLGKADAYTTAINGFSRILGYLDGIAEVQPWN